jgi:hypothetical protein
MGYRLCRFQTQRQEQKQNEALDSANLSTVWKSRFGIFLFLCIVVIKVLHVDVDAFPVSSSYVRSTVPCPTTCFQDATNLYQSPLFTTWTKQHYNPYYQSSNTHYVNRHRKIKLSRHTLNLWKDIIPDTSSSTKEGLQKLSNDDDEATTRTRRSSIDNNSTSSILTLMTNEAVQHFSKFMVPIVTVVNNNWTSIAVTFLTEGFVKNSSSPTLLERAARTTTSSSSTESEPQANLFSFISSITIPPIPFLSSSVAEEGSDTPSSSVAKPYQKYMVKSQDLSVEAFGPLLPLAERVDEWTGGWGLFYADLSPETTTSPLGITFLLTNLAYALAGFLLTIRGEIVLGTMTECAGAVSFWYHYSQLKYSGQEKNVQVRLALLTDYIFAGSALITGGLYALILGPFSLPLGSLLSAVAAVLCLALSWKWEFGLPYILWHSLWHILSALTGYLIGQAYIDSSDAAAAVVTAIIFFLLR